MVADDRNQLAALAQALAFDDRERWAEAHDLVASSDGPLAAWVHAYLHRKEGDLGNARYWYARAGQTPRTGLLADERAELDATLRDATGSYALNSGCKTSK